MKGRSRASRKAIQYRPNVLTQWAESRGAWYETPEEVDAGLRWGRRKKVLLQWVRRQMVERLDDRERRCLELYFFRNRSYKQIGEDLGRSKSTVHRIAHRAIRKLQAAAEEDTSWKLVCRQRRR